MVRISGFYTKYKNYDRQKCFVAHSLGAEWSEDLKSACAAILPSFNLEPWYAADHFDPTQTLRDKVVELIANSRYGIYDISSWQDKQGNWQLPRNVFIELGIAIALNRPTLLLRHSSNKNLPLPTCLQGVETVEFTGDITLKKELEKRLPQWLDVPPDRDWLNRFCIFGNRVCSFREQHPCSQQWGQKTLHCHIADGLDKQHPNYCQSECNEIRGTFEEILSRYSDLEFSYLDERSVVDGYQFLLCSHCQTVRSTPFAIYRISPTTSAETFVAIGISIALEKLFAYKIPKILLVRQEQDLPSLLYGYEVFEVVGTSDIKQKLRTFLPKVIQTVRKTSWRPRLLPFIETSINSFEETAFQKHTVDKQATDVLERMVYVENLSSDTAIENIKEFWTNYGTVLQVDLPADPKTGQKLNLALIEMEEVRQAEDSVKALNGAEWMGHKLIVRIANSNDAIYTRSQFHLNTSVRESNTQSEDNSSPQNSETDIVTASSAKVTSQAGVFSFGTTLDGSLRNQLHAALLSAFRSREKLAQMVSFELEENLEAIVEGSTQSARIFSLIGWAEECDRLEDLINGAREQNPTNKKLQNFSQQLFNQTSTSLLSAEGTSQADVSSLKITPLRSFQREQLYSALLSAFRSRDKLAQMVSFKLNENLENISSGQTHSECVFYLIKWAEATDRLVDLINGAREQNPTNKKLKNFAEQFFTEALTSTL